MLKLTHPIRKVFALDGVHQTSSETAGSKDEVRNNKIEQIRVEGVVLYFARRRQDARQYQRGEKNDKIKDRRNPNPHNAKVLIGRSRLQDIISS